MVKILFPLGIFLCVFWIFSVHTSDLEASPAVSLDCIASIPGSISPNGDGINDRFYIRYTCRIDAYQLSIRDQGRQVVFFSESPNVFWDGTVQGTPLPQGYYFWEVSYQVENRWMTRKGSVAIVR